MSGKFVVFLFLAIQVSLCLAQEPSPELQKKYDDLKAAVYSRLLQIHRHVKETLGPLLEESENVKEARKYFEDLQKRPDFEKAVNILKAMGEEAVPLVDKTRSMGLGLYEQYLRSYVGFYLDQGITQFRSLLHSVWPLEN